MPRPCPPWPIVPCPDSTLMERRLLRCEQYPGRLVACCDITIPPEWSHRLMCRITGGGRLREQTVRPVGACPGLQISVGDDGYTSWPEWGGWCVASPTDFTDEEIFGRASRTEEWTDALGRPHSSTLVAGAILEGAGVGGSVAYFHLYSDANGLRGVARFVLSIVPGTSFPDTCIEEWPPRYCVTPCCAPYGQGALVGPSC